MYLPILPKHVWQGMPVDKVGDFVNKPPVVGTGPYQVVDWKNGQSARLVRNETYWGEKGAADEIVFQFFPDATNAMVDAFKNGELDYIRNPTGLQFDQLKTLPNVVAINSAGNGFTQINFNCYDKDIPDGGASTKALRDPAFRAALGYAIDRDALISRVLNGYGTPGTTQVPAWQRAWHTEPNNVRQVRPDGGRPEARGSRLPASRRRALRQGEQADQAEPPCSRTATRRIPKDAQFIADWFGQIGIGVTPRSVDSGTLGTTEYLDTRSRSRASSSTTWSSGLGRLPGPELAAPDPDDGRDQRLERQPVVEPQYDQLYTQQNEAPTSRSAQGPDGPDAAALLRPGAIPDALLRRRAARLPHHQVLELADPAGQRRHAVLRQRLDQLHHAQAGVGGLAVAVGRRERVGQRRRQPGAPPAPPRRRSRPRAAAPPAAATTRTLAHPRHRPRRCIGIGAAVVLARRRQAAAVEDE